MHHEGPHSSFRDDASDCLYIKIRVAGFVFMKQTFDLLQMFLLVHCDPVLPVGQTVT